MKDVVLNTGSCKFEEIYLRLRQKEGRVYSDEEVAHLPEIHATHPHQQEWKLRKNSAEKLLKYLQQKKQALKILEVGSGNGWLSAKLASDPSHHVTGIDINSIELQQAKRVFQHKQNIEFFNCSLRDDLLKDCYFDLIVFAASIQYFSSLREIIQEALHHLLRDGEIHILDSAFYRQNELAAARRRSGDYYDATGFPEMTGHYFHHCLDEIKIFNYTLLYNPDAITRFLIKNKSPFYWVSIQQQ
ncbi:MAG TPA: class I SAM-dependent methyltransferase [Chitinophagaceae bacterium]|nr:class I SAM-dependent methyltransferase [Chitinophagaceae bacterium]